MNDRCIYTLELRGWVTESELNPLSPIQLTVTQAGPEISLLTCSTDQSGLVGLIRCLHGLGFVFLSIHRIDNETIENR